MTGNRRRPTRRGWRKQAPEREARALQRAAWQGRKAVLDPVPGGQPRAGRTRPSGRAIADRVLLRNSSDRGGAVPSRRSGGPFYSGGCGLGRDQARPLQGGTRRPRLL